MLLSNFAVGCIKKSRFIIEQETNRLLNSLGIHIPFISKIPIIG